MPFILAGIGMGLFFAPIANVVLSAVRPDQEGKASGATNTIREVGGVFGVAVLAAIFSANGSYVSPAAYVAGLQPAIAVGAVVVGFGAVAALFIPARAGARRRRGPGRGTHGRRGTARGACLSRPTDGQPNGRVCGTSRRVPCRHALRRQPRVRRRRHRSPRSATGRLTKPRPVAPGRARRGPRSCWSTGSANTPVATSTSATNSRLLAWTCRRTTIAGWVDPAAGVATSSAGRNSTTIWLNDSRSSASPPLPDRWSCTANRWAA